jgi:L-ribulokinase
MVEEKLVLGLDFGTDSVRAVIVNTLTGREEAVATCIYPRWQSGLYTEPGLKQFRHHPLDYLESLQQVVKEALAMLPP